LFVSPLSVSILFVFVLCLLCSLLLCLGFVFLLFFCSVSDAGDSRSAADLVFLLALFLFPASLFHLSFFSGSGELDCACTESFVVIQWGVVVLDLRIWVVRSGGRRFGLVVVAVVAVVVRWLLFWLRRWLLSR
jgi:hypothetical protein